MIKNIVIVGSGVMGRGIAYVSALGGYSVTIVDINEQALANAEKEIELIITKGLDRKKITQQVAKEIRV